MAVIPYATRVDLSRYLSPDVAVPDDADRLLARASERVDDFVLAGFTLAPDGLPADTAVRVALSDATCAQVEFWMEVGEEHDIDGIRGGVSVPGVSYDSPPTLAPRARSTLARVGLMNVGSVGT